MNRFLRCLKLALILEAIACVAVLSAQAQYDTLSDPLSDPIGANLALSDTTVAPSSSGIVVPGANNLLEPDERVPLLDATGSTLISTRMTPANRGSLAVSKTSSQVDGALKDSLILAASQQALSSGVSGSSALQGATSSSATASSSFSTGRLGVSSSSSFSVASNRGMSTSGNAALNSSWRVGTKTNAIPDLLAARISAVTNSKTDDSTTMAPLKVVGAGDLPTQTSTAGSSVADKARDRNAAPSREPSSKTKERDFSKSPLERQIESTTDDQDPGDVSPFKSLGTTSYLDPNIFSPTTPSMPSGNQEQSFTGNQSATNNLLSSAQRSRKRRKATGTTQLDSTESSIETKSERRLQRMQRPKWHNPILQQMEDGSSTPQ
jgi:hypothetical protein